MCRDNAPASLSSVQMRDQALAALPRYNRRDFEVVGRIGKGAYGGVWQATIVSTQQKVALKVVFPDPDLDPREAANASPTPSQLNSFRREIKILAAIGEHPNIACLLGITADFRVLVLPEGMCNLHHMIKAQKRGLNLGVVRRWSHELLTGLAHLHRLNIIHRDLAATNVLIYKDMALKICDFGMAAEAHPATPQPVQRETCTLWYRAPELIMGAEEYTAKIDMWSVGIVILEMLLGKCPTAGRMEDVCKCPKSTHFNFNKDQLAKIFRLVGTPTSQEFLNKMHCLQHFESWATYTPQLAQVVTNAVTFRLTAPSNTSTTTTENSKTLPVKLLFRGEKLVTKGPEQQTLDLRRLTNSSESNERPSAPLSTRRVKSVGDSQQNPASSRMPQIEKSLEIQILRDHLSPVTRNVIQKAPKSCVRSKSNPENELACACEGARRPERNLSAAEIQLDFEIQLKAFQNQAAVADATTTPGEWIEVLSMLLEMNPANRADCARALAHPLWEKGGANSHQNQGGNNSQQNQGVSAPSSYGASKKFSRKKHVSSSPTNQVNQEDASGFPDSSCRSTLRNAAASPELKDQGATSPAKMRLETPAKVPVEKCSYLLSVLRNASTSPELRARLLPSKCDLKLPPKFPALYCGRPSERSKRVVKRES